MPSLEEIVLASPEPEPDIRSLLVPVDDYGLLVGSGRQVLLLNAAKRRGVENGDVESGCFKLPPGFLQSSGEEPVAPPSYASRPANVWRTVRMFGRTVTIQSVSDDGIEQALLPWKSHTEEGVAPEVPECDLRIESVGAGYVVSQKAGPSKVLAGFPSLSLWISKEIGRRIHDCSNWLLPVASGVYGGQWLAFPGLSRELAESLRPAGYRLLGESHLAILDDARLAPPGVSDTGIEAIVFPHCEVDAQAEWKKLPLIDTVFELLASELGPVENTAESWRRLIAALERTPAFEMRYKSTEEGIHLLESIARECRN